MLDWPRAEEPGVPIHPTWGGREIGPDGSYLAIARVLAGIRHTYGTSTGLAPVPFQFGSAMSAV
jgi:hypothetical protein